MNYELLNRGSEQMSSARLFDTRYGRNFGAE